MVFDRSKTVSSVLSPGTWILLGVLAAQAVPLSAQSTQAKKHHPPGQSAPPDPLLPDKPASDGRRWTGFIRAGMSWESGVTNRLGFNLSGKTLGSFGKRSLLLEYNYHFAEQEFCTSDGCQDQTVTDDLYGRLYFESRFGSRFSFLSRTSYERDKIQRLDFRVAEFVGLGIVLVYNEKIFLQVAPGMLVAQEEKNLGIDEGFDHGIGNLQFFTWAINPSWTFTQSSSAERHFDSSDDYMLEGHAGLTGLITKHWAVNFALVYDHENLVMEGRQKRDQKLTAGLQFNF